MEQQITWLILTVVLNALVTGTLIFYFQKRMETRFEQRSFEDQTKFKRLYEKRVEALETLYQKFIVFTDHLKEVIENSRRGEQVDHEMYDIVRTQSTEKYKDLLHYFENNRLFLSDKTNEAVWKIIISDGLLRSLVIGVFLDSTYRETVPYWFREQLPELFDSEATELELRNPDVYLQEIERIIKKQRRTIESLYKSVADTTN